MAGVVVGSSTATGKKCGTVGWRRAFLQSQSDAPRPPAGRSVRGGGRYLHAQGVGGSTQLICAIPVLGAKVGEVGRINQVCLGCVYLVSLQVAKQPRSRLAKSARC